MGGNAPSEGISLGGLGRAQRAGSPAGERSTARGGRGGEAGVGIALVGGRVGGRHVLCLENEHKRRYFVLNFFRCGAIKVNGSLKGAQDESILARAWHGMASIQR